MYPLALEGATSPSAVDVLEERRIAGMDATVLFARDAAALSAWLGEHGFKGRPALEAWLVPYVDRGFYLTAFRYTIPRAASAAPDDADARPTADPAFEWPVVTETKTVRLSFDTDAAFYPYREPEDVGSRTDRQLELFLVSDAPLTARFEGGREFVARPSYVRPLAEGLLDALHDALPTDTPLRVTGGSAAPWLSQVVDLSATRRGRPDLEFTTIAQEEVEPPPIVRTRSVEVPIPIELVPLLAVGGGIVWWRRRRGTRSVPR